MFNQNVVIGLFALVCGVVPTFAKAQTPQAVPALNNVLWVWLENASDSNWIGQKYIKNLRKHVPSVTFNKVLPIHPSTQANAVAMIAGTTVGIADNQLTRLQTPTIVDLLESKGIPWRVYAEDYPAACYVGEAAGDYRRYRVPFVSISRVQADRFECTKVVNLHKFVEENNINQLARFSVVIPSLAHSNNVKVLQSIIDLTINNSNRLENTTVIISTINSVDARHPELFTMILGNGVADTGQTVSTPYNIFNLLRTIEDGLSLGQLHQNDAQVGPMLGFWQ